MTHQLLILFPDGTSQPVELSGDRFSFGRSHDNSVFYPQDESLSRHHLELTSGPDGWTVADVGSRNGTRVNGAPISEPRLLRPRDRVEAGRCSLAFDDPGAGLREEDLFYAGSDDDTPAAATMMTSLEEVLQGHAAISSFPPAQASAPPRFIPIPYDHPAVRALVAAGTELGGNRPLPELFELILDLSMRAVRAERGLLMTLSGGRLVPTAMRGTNLRISSTVRDHVVGNRSSLLVRDARQDTEWSTATSVVEERVRSMMAVPLQAEGRVTGLIYVDWHSFAPDINSDDLSLLTVLANVAAIRIEQVRLAEVERTEMLLERELEQAGEIQRLLLPAGAPSIPGLDIAGHNLPCRTVGGDYYEFLPYSRGRVGLVLGDVAGKGLPAALLMAGLQSKVQVLAEESGDLAVLMARLDRITSARCPTNRFISLFFAVIDPATGEMSYCNAGHNPPLLIDASGRIEWLQGGGLVLGILPERGYEVYRRRLAPGDVLTIFSDGVTDAAGPEEGVFGEERLARLVSSLRGEPASRIVEGVNRALAAWIGEAHPADDITLVVARRTA